jgi:hypothetical protein
MGEVKRGLLPVLLAGHGRKRTGLLRLKGEV